MPPTSVFDALRETICEEESAEQAAIVLLERAQSLLIPARAELGNFHASLLDRWGSAFDAFELLLAGCRDTGRAFELRYVPQAREANDHAVNALRRLWGASCVVGDEILTLLRAGYGAGAFARWRSLHELSVVALFIGEHGEQVAERYLAHQSMRTIDARHEYQRWAEQANEERFVA